ncbi:aldehyde dehydrogenase family protein [Mycobacterium sp.]|uniref:aldehyde dehydrogenase family protein n=1 Tax=Mycobacterium sp. TaxID=1785 RepID=UPI001278023F|nr:aldehyde dehydrogenase family protein [Mycobacterium sp.]KAA8969536.1 MAG: aldehyde dehydrogenase family protein [Mycobacterium sp.]
MLADRVSAVLIDGKLSPGSAGVFPTVNPATEEVLGAAVDATSFGGYKQSGNGREMGLAGFEEYLEIKVVATAV